MRKLIDLLNSKSSKMLGRTITMDEEILLRKAFADSPILQIWISWVKNFELIEHSFSLREDQDLAGLGVEMEIFTPKNQIEEAFSFYPGIAAIGSGYFPIGACLLGSGDPYFLKEEDGALVVFRILHDAITDLNEINQENIERVNTFEFFVESI